MAKPGQPPIASRPRAIEGRVRRTGLACGLALLITITIGTRLVAADHELPKPTGKFGIGRMAFCWSDQSRGDDGVERPGAVRQLRVELFYPAAARAGGESAPYVPNSIQLKDFLGPERVITGSIRTHGILDAEPLDGEGGYPVVLLSPGNNGMGVYYSSLAEELASHGYLVAAIDHPTDCRCVLLCDGTVVPFVDRMAQASTPEDRKKAYSSRVEVRAADASFVLDQLTDLNAGRPASRLAGHLDLARVGFMGHSIGGVAAGRVAQRDARFKAVANMDGRDDSRPFYADEQGRGPRQPFLDLTKGFPTIDDKLLARWKVTREEAEAAQARSRQKENRLIATVAGGATRVTIAGVKHMTFSDEVLWFSGTSTAPQRTNQIIRDYLRAFFDRHLQGRESPILTTPPAEHAEVTVERFDPQR